MGLNHTSSLNRKVSFSIEDASASDACPDLVYDSSDSELDSVSPARAPGPARRSELSNSLYQTNIADAYLQAPLHIPDSFYVRANKSITAHHIDDSITFTVPDGANSIIDTPNTDSDYDSVPPLVQVSEASDSDDSVVNYLVRQRKKRADPVIRGPVNKPDTDSDDSAPGIVTRDRRDSQSDSDFYDVPMSNLGGTSPVPESQISIAPSPYELVDRTARRQYLRKVRSGKTLTSTQLNRALIVMAYHRASGHKSMTKIRQEIQRGSLVGLEAITTTDVDNAVATFGPCSHCLAGKMRSPSQTSNAIPSNAVPGQYWELDFMFTHHANAHTKHPILICVCLLTGFIICIPLPSRGIPDVERAGQILHRAINSNFPAALATGIIRIFNDHEPSFQMLAAQIPGCRAEPRPIGDHANTVERYIGIIGERLDAHVHQIKIESKIDLPGVVYPKLVMNIARLLNYEAHGDNTKSPNEMLFGKKLNIDEAINATFGQLVMAKVPTDQIHGSFSSHIGMIVGCESATPTNLYVFDPATGHVKHRAKCVPIQSTEAYVSLFNAHSNKMLKSSLKKVAAIAAPSVPIEHIDENTMSISDAIAHFGIEPVKDCVRDEMDNLMVTKEKRDKALVPVKASEMKRGIPTLPTKGFIKAKYKNGTFSKLKYRLTAGGHRQRDGTYGNTTAPTVHVPNIFLVCSIAKQKKLVLDTVDIPGAYLHAPLPASERVYVRINKATSAVMVMLDPSLKDYLQPDGTLIFLVLMALYGMKQAGNLWHDFVSKSLLRLGFKRSLIDAALFYRVEGQKLQIIGMHVDDLFHACNCASWNEQLKKHLKSAFGPLVWEKGSMDYLGMHFEQRKDFTVAVDMGAMIQRIVTKAGITQGARTPSSATLFSDLDDPNMDFSANISKYRSQVAELIYLTKLRVDINMEATHCATLVPNPGPKALKKLDRVHRYLFATSQRPVIFGTDEVKLEIFADASYACHPITMHSHGGHLVRIGPNSGVIYAKSKEQKMVTGSSTEAELLELSQSVKCGIPIARLLMELEITDSLKFIVYQDNKSTLHLAYNGEGFNGKANFGISGCATIS